MNKKAVAVLVPVMLICIVFIAVNINTMLRYRETPGDWHFILSIPPIFIFCFFFIVTVKRLIKLRRLLKGDITQEPPASENKKYE